LSIPRFISSQLVRTSGEKFLPLQAFTKLFSILPAEVLNTGAWVGAYVIMPDHLHLFVSMDDQRIMLSAWMKSLKNTASKALRMNRIPPPHWQKTFFDHLVRNSESYSEKWSYVRENPVLAGLVSKNEDWAFMGEIFALEYHRD
jgi:putative transposase